MSYCVSRVIVIRQGGGAAPPPLPCSLRSHHVIQKVPILKLRLTAQYYIVPKDTFYQLITDYYSDRFQENSPNSNFREEQGGSFQLLLSCLSKHEPCFLASHVAKSMFHIRYRASVNYRSADCLLSKRMYRRHIKKILNSDPTKVKSMAWKKNQFKYSLNFCYVVLKTSILKQLKTMSEMQWMIGLKLFTDQ